MKTLTLQVFDEDTGTITHESNVTHETWIKQLEEFSRFLLAQGFSIDGRIAVVEPDVGDMHPATAKFILDTFYEQLHEVCWTGAVASQSEINSKE